MADLKISQLDAITTLTPATDVLPVVNVGGVTKKITTNQILGSGGTATLASATITGALTIGGATSFPASIINTSGGNPVFTPTAATLFLYSGSSFLSIRNQANTQEIFNLTPAGVYTFGDGSGNTRMTLNSTGLGVGVVPAAGKLQTAFSAVTSVPAAGATGHNFALGSTLYGIAGGSLTSGNSYIQSTRWDGTGTNYDLVLNPNGGNVGVGVVSAAGKFEVSEAGTGLGTGSIFASTVDAGGNPGYVFRTASTNRWAINIIGTAGTESIRFYDANAAATRMLIDTSGNLLVNVPTTPPTLAVNSQMVFNLTSNTNLRISVRGTDGTTRTANITLA
jgi:hypothetical protein